MQIPTLIDHRYRLDSQLGAGGMGVVYRAYDRLNDRPVALKRLSIPVEWLDFMSMATSSNLLLSLAHEFEMAASLRHPHIVSVLDYGFDAAQSPYLVMELLEEAQPITAYGAGRPLAEQVDLLMQTLQALVYLHRRGIIHRDLKPDNLLVRGKRVKVLDFGLSVTRGQEAEIEGTIHYVAPEVLQKQRITEAADLYGVGVIAYQMLTGSPPFVSNSLDALVNEVIHQPVDVGALDVPEGITAILQRLLAKDPASRGSAAEALAAFGRAVGQPVAQSAAVRESYLQAAAFVGREAELARLQGALQQASAGAGQVWLVGGESGVGKSRLLDELRTRALVRGVRVLRGQSVAEGGLPYQLWRGIVRRLALSTALSDLEAGVLREIAPDIETLLGRAVPPIPNLEGSPGQQRLQLTLVELLRRQREPTLLLFEDLHWASESLEPLKLLPASLGDSPLLVVGTYRDDERPDLPASLGDVHLLALDRLTQRDIETLSASMLGAAGQREDVVNLLQRETEGNVFFLVETVRALAAITGRLENIGQMTLPSTVFAGGVQQVVRRRLQQVDARHRPLLKLAAVAGRQLDLTILAQVQGDVELDSWLLACQDAAVLEVQDEVWRFSHDKLREALRAELAPEERSTLHGRIATAMEAAYPDDPAYYESLLEHWQAAGNVSREAAYILKLGKRLITHGTDYERVADLLRRGLSLTVDEVSTRRVKLLNLASLLSIRRGHTQTARAYAEQALRLARRVGDASGQARSLTHLARAAINIGALDDVETHARSSIAIYERLGDTVNAARATMLLGTMHYYRGDYRQSWRYHHQSYEILRAQGERVALMRSLINLAGVADALGDQPTSLEYNTQALGIAQDIGDMAHQSIALNNLGVTLNSMGEYAAAITRFKQCLALRFKLQDQRGIAITLSALSTSHLERGDFDSALEDCQASIRLATTIEDKITLADGYNQVGFIYNALGSFEQAYTHHERALDVFQSIGDQYGIGVAQQGLGRVANAQGDYEEAWERLSLSRDLFQQSGNKVGIANCNHALGENALLRGEWHIARQHYDAALELHTEVQNKRSMAEDLLGLGAAHSRSDAQAAAEHFSAALNLVAAIQLRPMSLAALAFLARWWVYERDPERAAQLVGLLDRCSGLHAGVAHNQLLPLRQALDDALDAETRAQAHQAIPPRALAETLATLGRWLQRP